MKFPPSPIIFSMPILKKLNERSGKIIIFWISDSCSQFFLFYLSHASKVRTTRDDKTAKKSLTATTSNHVKAVQNKITVVLRQSPHNQEEEQLASVFLRLAPGKPPLRRPVRKSQDGKCLSGCSPSVCGVAVKPSVFLDCQCLSVRVSARS